MQPFEKEQPPGVGAPKAAEANTVNTGRLAKKRRQHKLFSKELLTGDKLWEADCAIELLLRPFLYEGRHFAPDYLLLRNIEIDRDRDGRVKLDIVDIKDALWDALADQNERAKGEGQ
jgi:hypothetical protein